jgi:hypothetical protein
MAILSLSILSHSLSIFCSVSRHAPGCLHVAIEHVDNKTMHSLIEKQIFVAPVHTRSQRSVKTTRANTSDDIYMLWYKMISRN